MTEAAIQAFQPSSRGRQTKFTPENIRQIINLVERGKSKDEIAEVIGVTPGTLQVSCSKMGISLRRPSFDIGTGPLRRRPQQNKARSATIRQETPSEVRTEPEIGVKLMDENVTAPQQEEIGRSTASSAPAASFAIRMLYRGDERITELPLSPNMVRQLALEAEFRNIKIGDLIGRLIMTITEHDLFQSVLDHQESKLRLVQSDGPAFCSSGKALA